MGGSVQELGDDGEEIDCDPGPEGIRAWAKPVFNVVVDGDL